MKQHLSTDPIVSAASASDLRDFGALLANPSEIDAIVRGPVFINRSNFLLDPGDTAVIFRSGVVIEIKDSNEARALYDAFRNGVRQ